VPLIAPGPIETERLVVRRIVDSDLAALMAVNSDEAVTALLPYATWTSAADAEAWLDRMRGIEATGLAFQFVVALKSAERAIGTCLLFRYEEGSARAELGYALGRACWGQGFMHEALAGLLGSAFDTMGLRRVEAEVDPANGPSARLLLRLGFTKEGLLRQRWVTKGKARDVEVYGLLRDEWLARAGRG
jgi:RimJ/RimL family protein N-acetyltransferase